MAYYYFKHAGHCTSCAAPFAADATMSVAWQVLGHGDNAVALTQVETVAVCERCLTPKEQALSTDAGTCGGCGRARWVVTSCCDRCAQRTRRKRYRIKMIKCTVCKTTLETARADAKFCSGQCRQWAYRLRRSAGRS